MSQPSFRSRAARAAPEPVGRLVGIALLAVSTIATVAWGQPTGAPRVSPAVSPNQPTPAEKKPQTVPKPGPTPKEQPAQPAPKDEKAPPERPKDPALPSLDELLGITGNNPAGTGTPDPSKRDLDRLLSGAEVGDAFKEAAALMGDAAERLQKARDTGVVTQRVQDDIVKRLDQLINSLENMQSQSSSSSSGSQQQSPTNQQLPNQQSRGQRQEGQGENQGAAEPPARRDGPLRPGMEAVRSSWGKLPDRVRDMLVQGRDDAYSQLYAEMTKAYYRKLAEEAKSKP